MKLIQQSHTILGTPKNISEAWNFVEQGTRTCYQSERKNNNETPEQFCRRILLKHEDWVKNHGAMLEHGAVYLKIPYNTIHRIFHMGLCSKYINHPYCKTVEYVESNPENISTDNGITSSEFLLITTNLRVILENGWEEDLQYACEPLPKHEKRITVRFITNRAMLAELTRHRKFSFAVESTRYCNYTTDKFGNELTFIQPCWMEEVTSFGNHAGFEEYLKHCETLYFDLVNSNWKPQQAATILPNALKVNMIMTGFESDWTHFFRLRAEQASGPVHPQMLELVLPFYDEYQKQFKLKTNDTTDI